VQDDAATCPNCGTEEPNPNLLSRAVRRLGLAAGIGLVLFVGLWRMGLLSRIFSHLHHH
jgi:hypothetical protein